MHCKDLTNQLLFNSENQEDNEEESKTSKITPI